MTPHELNLHIVVYSERLKREGENGLTLAYLTAYWQRVKRMPDLQKLIGQEKKPKREQSTEEMLRTIKSIHAANGGETS